jgi:hypothetical protein
MFQVFQVVQLAIGFFMWTLIGQGALALLIGEKRHANPVYRVFAAITWPVWWAARRLSPKALPDARMGIVALLLLLALRFAIYMLFYAAGWIPTVGVTSQP